MQQAHILFPFICFEWSGICHSISVSLNYRAPNARNSNETDRALKLQMIVLHFVLGSRLRLPLSLKRRLYLHVERVIAPAVQL